MMKKATKVGRYLMKKATKVGRYLRKVWVMVMKEIKLCLLISYLSVLLLAS